MIKYFDIAAREGETAMTQKMQNLQDAFLNQARRERLLVTVFLMNGFQMKGVIRGFDSFAVILDSDGKPKKKRKSKKREGGEERKKEILRTEFSFSM